MGLYSKDIASYAERSAPEQTLVVYRGCDLKVVSGANLGDSLRHADDIELADSYQLSRYANGARLSIHVDEERLTVAGGSEICTPGNTLHLDCIATLMGLCGATVEILVVVETDAKGMIEDVLFLPFAPLKHEAEYALIKLDTENVRARLGEVACLAFSRGTRITLANGLQKPIEDLSVGDSVLTRDNGPRTVRWIGMTTMRATGAFAPIVIKAGAFDNTGDLMLSPNHRIFIRDRQESAWPKSCAEVLVKARHLVNGHDVIQAEGGFVDYFQLMFDEHETIFAEGLAAESMFADSRAQPFLPATMRICIAEGHTVAQAGRKSEMRPGVREAKAANNLLRLINRD
ncbi:Hint domain-containing protein [Celeribacter litoreus]|uniref:Hint domain-containing protein n=1 Tax=Celeribacter litoreus TaxID=2876714 RepID=UPI001CCB713A|nr:Hint domain-containing protein [Celeribacter litoreus]MCA0045284.1 Hint domain-containing protein [Celeribacter litoreus]